MKQLDVDGRFLGRNGLDMKDTKKVELRHRIQTLLNDIAGLDGADVKFLAEVNAKLQELVDAQ